MFKRKFKKIISICLSMILVCSLVLPVYAAQPDYEFDEDTGILVIGKAIEKKPITHIVPPSISQDSIIVVIVREGVKKLSDGAFMNCKNLQKVKIPNSMKSIGSGAFKGCISLQKINISDNVICSNDAFEGCEQLYIPNLQPTFPSAPTFLPLAPTCPSDESFINSMNGWQLENGAPPYVENPMNAFMPTLPNQIQVPVSTDVNKNMNSNSLEKESTDEKEGHFVIGKEIENKTIEDIVSIPKEKIESVTIKDGVTSIRGYAFSGCRCLTSVTIPNSVTSIGDHAFYDCTGLTSVTIPNSVTSIGSWAFKGCTGLTSVTIPNSVTSIGSWAFAGCTGLTSVTIPNSVTEIGSRAFYGCTGLKEITVPNSAKIANNAFSCITKVYRK